MVYIRIESGNGRKDEKIFSLSFSLFSLFCSSWFVLLESWKLGVSLCLSLSLSLSLFVSVCPLKEKEKEKKKISVVVTPPLLPPLTNFVGVISGPRFSHLARDQVVASCLFFLVSGYKLFQSWCKIFKWWVTSYTNSKSLYFSNVVIMIRLDVVFFFFPSIIYTSKK